VGVLGCKQHGGEEHFIVRQPDGTLMLLPAWMTNPDAGAFRIISDPRLPVNRLSHLRILIDLLLASPKRESARARGSEGSVRDANSTEEYSEQQRSTDVGVAQGSADGGSRRRHRWNTRREQGGR
jgi:hypothetical protein